MVHTRRVRAIPVVRWVGHRDHAKGSLREIKSVWAAYISNFSPLSSTARRSGGSCVTTSRKSEVPANIASEGNPLYAQLGDPRCDV